MPKKVNGYTQAKAHAKKRRKQYEADDRQAKYNALTIAEKFSTLIEGGSKRQRAKLEKQLEKEAAKSAVKPTVKPTKAPKK